MIIKQILSSIRNIWNKTNNKVDKTILVTTNNTDLNDYIEEGTYFFNSSYTPKNIPAGVNGWLEVFKGSDNWVKQLWYRAGTNNDNDYNTYVRTKNGASSEWSKWKRMQAGDIVLYENNSGTAGTVTLSDTAENYYYFEIFYKTNDNLYGSHKVNSPQRKEYCYNIKHAEK